MTTSFPLLNLPTKAISHVLKSMNINEFITLSFLSKRAKLSVEAMEFKSPNVIVQIDEFVNIFMTLGENIWRWSFHGDETENGTMNRALPNKLIELSIYQGPIEWSMKDLSVKKWISHFQTIFHFSKFNSIQLSTASFLYDIEEIKATVGNFETLYLSRTGTNNEGYDLLVKYFVSRCLILDSGVFKCLERPKDVLIQNYDELEITSVSSVSIILDDLLMVNSKTVMLGYINWTEKEVNQFIKHWMKGSNPRLEILEIFLTSRGEVFNRTVALKCIRYIEIPDDHVRKFKTFDLVNLDIEGGYDFQRSDGTTATITFCYGEESVLLQMYVWHPHCVGDS